MWSSGIFTAYFHWLSWSLKEICGKHIHKSTSTLIILMPAFTWDGFASNDPTWFTLVSLRWRHNDHDGVSNHQPHCCLFRRRSMKLSKLCVTGLCAGNSPVTGGFPAQRASNAENVSIWWRHHVSMVLCNTICIQNNKNNGKPQILLNTDLGFGLLPDGTKPKSKPMITGAPIRHPLKCISTEMHPILQAKMQVIFF